ncbi:MAG: alpha/beta hydrolase family protein [Verrucomicrobiota bacterium]|jgi:pimeloyl-ACP methyl ester carboxylesterase
MMALLCKLVDRTAIQFAALRMPGPDERDAHLAEARQFLRSPEFVPPRVDLPAVEFIGPKRFRFATPRPTAFAENDLVHGRLYRCQRRWQERPAVVLLHGWNDLINHRLRFPLVAWQFNQAGLNAAAIELPFHFQRRPRQLGARGNFLCPDILRTARAIAQAIAEIRAVSHWLRAQGCPAVGLLGVSLGALLAGLTVCRDAQCASCAALIAPIARLDRLIQEAAFCRGIAAALRGQPMEADTLNLTACRPVIPTENILLVEAVHDLFAPPETIEELCRAWGGPEIWRLRHGHVGVVGAPGLTRRIIGWMAPRLGEAAAK